MTTSQIVVAIRRRSGVKTDGAGVTRVLVMNRRLFRLHRRHFLLRKVRWQLVEAGPADAPGNAGAPVPAWPYRPLLSGAASARLTFREDEPPADAISKSA